MRLHRNISNVQNVRKNYHFVRDSIGEGFSPLWIQTCKQLYFLLRSGTDRKENPTDLDKTRCGVLWEEPPASQCGQNHSQIPWCPSQFLGGVRGNGRADCTFWGSSGHLMFVARCFEIHCNPNQAPKHEGWLDLRLFSGQFWGKGALVEALLWNRKDDRTWGKELYRRPTCISTRTATLPRVMYTLSLKCLQITYQIHFPREHEITWQTFHLSLASVTSLTSRWIGFHADLDERHSGAGGMRLHAHHHADGNQKVFYMQIAKPLINKSQNPNPVTFKSIPLTPHCLDTGFFPPIIS